MDDRTRKLVEDTEKFIAEHRMTKGDFFRLAGISAGCISTIVGSPSRKLSEKTILKIQRVLDGKVTIPENYGRTRNSTQNALCPDSHDVMSLVKKIAQSEKTTLSFMELKILCAADWTLQSAGVK